MLVLTIYVSNPSSVLTLYDQIKVYRSDYSNGYFSEVSDITTRVSLDADVKYYIFEDTSSGATSSSYYTTSYYNSSTTSESSQSTPGQGIEVEDEYYNITYPPEKVFTAMNFEDIDSIRFYIGDNKKVVHEYVSPSCVDGYQSVSSDGYTYEMNSKGWPLSISKDSVSYLTLDDPVVTDYRYITFSGSSISTVSGVIDLWYESFRWSDREVLKVFNKAPIPAGVSSSSVTDEMYHLTSALNILKSEITDLMGQTSGKVNLDGEFSYDPEPLLRQKRAYVSDLEKKLEDLISASRLNSLEGVLLD